jgi:Mu-like prophage I protein
MNEEDNSQPIECRAAVAISPTATNEITFLPAGVHAIRPVSGGIGRPIKVLIDARAAGEIERQRGEIQARTDKRVYFDFNHEDGRASFWPHSFIWRSTEGVVAKGEWSASGKKAVEGKDFRAFSPVFHVDDKRKDPARVVCCEAASPNMGGLVNDPAFSALPLWAKNAGATSDADNNKPTGETKMTTEEIAVLRDEKKELEAKVENLTALAAKESEDETVKSQLDSASAELRARNAELEVEELKAKNQAQDAIIRKRNEDEAEVHIKAAIKRGAILPKNLKMQQELKTKATADPSFNNIIDGMMGNGNGQDGRWTKSVGGPAVQITHDDPTAVYARMAQVLSNSARSSSREDKARCAEEFGAIYAGEFKETSKNQEQRTRLLGTRLNLVDDAIKAADVTDTNLGTIAGTLVTQRTLELLKFVFPPLTRFTTDFSDQPATYNQTIITRIITVPAVVTYSTATGWADVTATTTDVSVTINNHKGIPITFNENLLASTMRQLFNEFAEASAYALGKALVDALYANLTDANFTNNTVSASTAFNRAAVIDVGTALTTRGVPLALGNRTMLLWPAAFGNLEKDTTIGQYATNVPAPPIITDGVTPESAFYINVEGFKIYDAPNMPSNNANLVGFAGSKSALVMVTRTPNDYTTVLPGASFGNVQMVTDPDIGITVMQVQYVNHTLGTATSRIALMWGTAAGQTAAGQLIKASAGSGSSR